MVNDIYQRLSTALLNLICIKYVHTFTSRNACRARAGVASGLVPVTPPPINVPSLQLQTLSARSRSLIHCISARLEEAQSTAPGSLKKSDYCPIKLQVNYFLGVEKR